MTDREVMQRVLANYDLMPPTVRMDYFNGTDMEALRSALAQSEPEPVAYITKRKNGGTEGLLRADMVDRSAKNQETHYFIPLYKDPTPCQTCEALARTVMLDQTSHDTKPEHGCAECDKKQSDGWALYCVDCLSEFYKQPEQGPVGQLQEEAYGRGQVLWFKKLADQSMLYTSLQKREWVGLTVEEVAEAGKLNIEGERMLPYSFARAIEAKLKEKNT